MQKISYIQTTAAKFGRNGHREAEILLSLAYWIVLNNIKGKAQKEGRTWTFGSYDEYTKYFPNYSKDQIKRSISKLVKSGVLLKKRYGHNVSKSKPNWYTIANPAESEEIIYWVTSFIFKGKISLSDLIPQTKIKPQFPPTTKETPAEVITMAQPEEKENVIPMVSTSTTIGKMTGTDGMHQPIISKPSNKAEINNVTAQNCTVYRSAQNCTVYKKNIGKENIIKTNHHQNDGLKFNSFFKKSFKSKADLSKAIFSFLVESQKGKIEEPQKIKQFKKFAQYFAEKNGVPDMEKGLIASFKFWLKIELKNSAKKEKEGSPQLMKKYEVELGKCNEQFRAFYSRSLRDEEISLILDRLSKGIKYYEINNAMVHTTGKYKDEINENSYSQKNFLVINILKYLDPPQKKSQRKTNPSTNIPRSREAVSFSDSLNSLNIQKI